MNPKHVPALRATIRLFFLLSICLTLAARGPLSAPAAYAQQQTSTEDFFKVERKNKAPVAPGRVPVKPIRFTEFKLENGLTVVVREDRRLPLVFVHLQIVGAGSVYEPPSRPGLANFTARVLLAGTRSRSAYQIADELNKMGALVTPNANFGSSVTTLTASGLSQNFNEWFAILTDVLVNPSFPPEMINAEQQRLKQSLQAPPFVWDTAPRQFKRAVFGEHPAGVLSATRESAEAFTPATLAFWHRDRYAPQNTILGITGDVNTAELLNLLKKSFANWHKNDFTRTLPPDPAPSAAKKIMFVENDNNFGQAILMAGDIAIERRSPDFFPLLVMNQVYGGAYTSRLYMSLRDSLFIPEGRGPTAPPETAYTKFNAMEYRGDWLAYSVVRADAVEKALPPFLRELSRISGEKVPEAELEDAKRLLATNYAFSLEDPTAILSNEITRKFYNLPEDYWDTFTSNVMAVTAEDVQRVAQKYVNPGTVQLVGAGPNGVRAALQKVGPVEIYGRRNDLKGCVPASPAGAEAFSSTVAQFVSFKNARVAGPTGDDKWNPANCLPEALECSINEGALTSCSMYRSAGLQEAETFYGKLVENVTAVLSENWKTRERGPASRFIKEFVARLEGSGSSVTATLREHDIGEGEDPSGKYIITLRFSGR